MTAVLLGRVVEFDDARGLGVVAGDRAVTGGEPAAAGGDRWGFHCTAVADGSRRIEPDAQVAFVVVPTVGGRFEAARVTKLSRSATSAH